MSVPASPAAFARPLFVRRTVALVLILFGINVGEQISNQIIPLSIRHHTADAFVIGLVLALNPLFGFIVQPIVGYWSDRVSTPLGRRAVFLCGAAPVVALALFLIPLCGSFVQMVLVIIVLQMFHDVLWGSQHPLLGDLIPAERRAMVAGFFMVASNLASLLILRHGLPAIERHEQANGGLHFGLPMYWLGAALTLGCVVVPALMLGEDRVARKAFPRFSLRSYAGDLLGRPMLRRFAALNFLSAFETGAIGGFMILFATQTLELSKSDYGRAASILPFVSIALAITVAFAVRRRGRNWLLAGAGALAVVAGLLGWFSRSLWDLIAAQIVFAIASVIFQTVFKSFLIEHIPRVQLGQISSALNIFWGGGRMSAMVAVGWIISRGGGNYRLMWPCLILAALANCAVALSFRDRPDPSIDAAAPRPV